MTLKEIKTAINNGQTVYWNSGLYEVRKGQDGDYYIFCTSNGSAIGLTWMDGVTLNGKEEEFFTINPAFENDSFSFSGRGEL